MKVMVLAGGPDRERDVSLVSGGQVAAALREAGHDVMERDMGPTDASALDAFGEWQGDVVFPVFHGKWGEGGGCQRALDAAGVRYVGCGADAAARCMNKTETKRRLMDLGLPTPEFEMLANGSHPDFTGPVVLKPHDDGSSIDLAICHTAEDLAAAWADLATRNEQLLVERFVEGPELTVGVIEDEDGEPIALPTIRIVPATAFYDYAAKYERDDTQYRFDAPPEVEGRLGALAVAVFRGLGCRHLARVDVMLDGSGEPWVIEVNTMPGFTTHSLLPMAAARAGLAMPALVDRLVRRAASG
ncbi:MAG: D-alanine--D-alanine ligase [Planctomycetota bacterium]